MFITTEPSRSGKLWVFESTRFHSDSNLEKAWIYAPKNHTPAGKEDLSALREIYNYYAENTHHTFDTEGSTADEFRNWFDQFSTTGRHRLVVAESNGTILGYANSRVFHPKPVYAQTVETGIFIRQDHRAAGIGTRLYQALLEILLNEESVHQIVASITLPNDVSLALHSKLGFREVGTFPEIGFKDERRWSLRWLIRSPHTDA